MYNSIITNKNKSIYIGNLDKKNIIRNLYYYHRNAELDLLYDKLLKYKTNVVKEDLIGSISEEDLDQISKFDEIDKINGVEIDVEFKDDLMFYSQREELLVLKAMFDLKYASGIFNNPTFSKFLGIMQKIRTEEQKLDNVLARNNNQLKFYKPKIENNTATVQEKKDYEDIENSNFEIRASKYSINTTEKNLLFSLFEIEKKMVSQQEKEKTLNKQPKKYI